MNEKSFELFSKEHASTQKFDYYICSVAGALFAYIGQTYEPHKLNSFLNCLTPVGLLCLVVCLLFGFLVIYQNSTLTRINKEMLTAQEMSKELTKILVDCKESYQNDYGEVFSRQDCIKIRKQKGEEVKNSIQKANSLMDAIDCLVICRNIFLVVGFILILAAKICQPYAN